MKKVLNVFLDNECYYMHLQTKMQQKNSLFFIWLFYFVILDILRLHKCVQHGQVHIRLHFFWQVVFFLLC